MNFWNEELIIIIYLHYKIVMIFSSLLLRSGLQAFVDPGNLQEISNNPLVLLLSFVLPKDIYFCSFLVVYC